MVKLQIEDYLVRRWTPWIIVAFAFVVRLLFLNHVEIVDSDAVSRALIAETWLDAPYWMDHGVWAPFHFYFLSLSIFISSDRVFGPIVITVIFGAFCALPVYRFTERLLNTNAAIISAVLFTFSPIIFRNSFQPIAGVPYAFFVAMSMWFILKALQDENHKKRCFLLGGLLLTVAAGMRYEAWVLVFLFSVVIAMYRQWNYLFWFWLTAMIFPFIWMVGNFIEYGNILYSVDYATFYNTKLAGVNDNLNLLQKNKRLLFFPQSLLVLIPFGLVIPLSILTVYKLLRSHFNIDQRNWLLPFFAILCVYIFKAFNGTLLLQHRFSITLALLIIPFIGLLIPKWKSNYFVFILITAGLTYPFYMNRLYLKPYPFFETEAPSSITSAMSENRFYSFNQIQPIPKLRDSTVHFLLEKTISVFNPDELLVLDFFGWENTYNFALNSGVDASKILFLPFDGMHVEKSFNEIERFKLRTGNYKGYMILNKSSGNMKNVILDKEGYRIRIENQEVPISLIDSIRSLYIFNFETN